MAIAFAPARFRVDGLVSNDAQPVLAGLDDLDVSIRFLA